MAAVAYLSGLEPAALEGARVLELGCASGGNLMCAAEALSDATFVGIDLADNQITDGNATVAAIGLHNVRLHAMSFADIPADFGQFDYIVAHGLYSWVAPPLQRQLLDMCKRHLSPAGLAYVSYNTYPGWRLRGMLRDIMLYARHAGSHQQGNGGTDFNSRMTSARQFAALIGQAAGNDDTEHVRALRRELDTLQKAPDWYAAHEYLDEYLEPIHFTDFVARAGESGLQYVGEARYRRGAYAVAERLKQLRPQLAQADPIGFEQCVDFAFGRQFRRSLLCHAGASVNYVMDPSRLMRCHITGGVIPTTQQVDPRPNVPVTFRAPDGATFSSTNPAVKVALLTLAVAAPEAVSFDALWDRVRQVLNLPRYGPDRDQLAQSLLALFQSDSIDVHRTAPATTKTISLRPVASPLVRWQAARSKVVHNRRHRPVRGLPELDLALLPLLDGSRDLAELAARIGSTGIAFTSPDIAVRESLQRLAANALLIA
jgi:SAM-dependent methyltransferase/methyltransferase-like protein